MTEENFEETQVEETTSQETEELDLDLELEEEQGEADVDNAEAQTRAKIKQLEETNAQLHARLKRAEKKSTATTSSNNSGLTREEAILFAKGHTEEEVDLAVKIAKVNDVSMLEAINDPYFKAKVNARVKKEKSSQASLGASGGTSRFVPKDTGSMSREDHMKLFHETMSRL